MSNGRAKWRNSGSKLAVDVDLIRDLNRQYSVKDVLREKLPQSKRSLHNAKIQNDKLRRQQGSGSKMDDYERKKMVKMMEEGVIQHGQIEAASEARVESLKAEVESLKKMVLKLKAEAAFHKKKGGNLMPSFYCPITMQILRDPVCTADGHTYERKCIDKWFANGNQTSPLTGAQLPRGYITPNHALRKAIQESGLLP